MADVKDKKKKPHDPSLGVELPDGVCLEDLKENFSVATAEYSKAYKKAVTLDKVDNNELWKAINAKYPSYQILPQTNHVSYVKSNILAAVYTVGRSASLIPTTPEDKEIVEQLNQVLDYIWSQCEFPYYQMEAGERAALMNLGITQVGWDNSVMVGNKASLAKGKCVLKNINPLRYMRDPAATDLDNASYVITWDDFHKSTLKANDLYKKEFKKYCEINRGTSNITEQTQKGYTDKVSESNSGKKGYYRIVYHWVRVGDKIHEIHTIDNNYVLHVVEDIQPSTFPFAELYCNLPVDSLFGTSEPEKILANSVAYNLMHSIILTSEYKNQRPPRFVNQQSNLNIASFKTHGNEADRTFVVAGDASKAVHYHQFPSPTQAAITGMATLAQDIKMVSGIDDRYTGRDTGSILTTGGINSMLDQVSVTDSTKIANYERYCKRLTKLILGNYIKFSATAREYLVKDPQSPKKYRAVKVDFPEIPDDTVFEYELAISPLLPKNKTAIANMANKLMEMQMQYSAQNIETDLITPQEWLMMQDLPMREYMMERMGMQRHENYTEAVTQIITQYAGLVQNGMNPDEALQVTAQTMQAQDNPQGNGVEDVIQNITQGGML